MCSNNIRSKIVHTCVCACEGMCMCESVCVCVHLCLFVCVCVFVCFIQKWCPGFKSLQSQVGTSQKAQRCGSKLAASAQSRPRI